MGIDEYIQIVNLQQQTKPNKTFGSMLKRKQRGGRRRGRKSRSVGSSERR